MNVKKKVIKYIVIIVIIVGIVASAICGVRSIIGSRDYTRELRQQLGKQQTSADELGKINRELESAIINRQRIINELIDTNQQLKKNNQRARNDVKNAKKIVKKIIGNININSDYCGNR